MGYMGYVLDELAEENQTVRGCIIALEDVLKLRRGAPRYQQHRFLPLGAQLQADEGMT